MERKFAKIMKKWQITTANWWSELAKVPFKDCPKISKEQFAKVVEVFWYLEQMQKFVKLTKNKENLEVSVPCAKPKRCFQSSLRKRNNKKTWLKFTAIIIANSSYFFLITKIMYWKNWWWKKLLPKLRTTWLSRPKDEWNKESH